MTLWLMLHREKIYRTAIIGILLIWAVASSALLTFKDREVLLLQIQDGKISPIETLGELNREDLRDLDRSFLVSFVNAFYHFDIENFEHNLGIAKGFFSEPGWMSVQKQVQSLREDLQKNFISQGAVIVDAKKLSEDTFKIKVKFYSAVSGETKVSFRNITLFVHQRELKDLSNQRPYPYEVTNVTEEAL